MCIPVHARNPGFPLDSAYLKRYRAVTTLRYATAAM